MSGEIVDGFVGHVKGLSQLFCTCPFFQVLLLTESFQRLCLPLIFCSICFLQFTRLPTINSSQLELRLNHNAIEQVSFEHADYNQLLQVPSTLKQIKYLKWYIFAVALALGHDLFVFSDHNLKKSLKFLDVVCKGYIHNQDCRFSSIHLETTYSLQNIYCLIPLSKEIWPKFTTLM